MSGIRPKSVQENKSRPKKANAGGAATLLANLTVLENALAQRYRDLAPHPSGFLDDNHGDGLQSWLMTVPKRSGSEGDCLPHNKRISVNRPNKLLLKDI